MVQLDGDSWTQRNAGLTAIPGTSLMVHGGSIIMGTNQYGVYKSTDGDSWTQHNIGLTKKGLVYRMCSDGPTLYAQVGPSEVYKSTDGDDTWATLTDLPLSGTVGAMAVHNGALYVGSSSGAFRLDGSAWVPVGAATLSGSVGTLLSSGGKLYASSGGAGAFRLDGDSWTPLNNEQINTNVSALAVYNGSLYASTSGGGIFRWQPAAPIVGNVTAPDAVAVGGTLSLTVPTVNSNNENITAQGWHISFDSGTTWEPFDPTTPLTDAHNGALLRYFATNSAGTSYSNTVTIRVDTANPDPDPKPGGDSEWITVYDGSQTDTKANPATGR